MKKTVTVLLCMFLLAGCMSKGVKETERIGDVHLFREVFTFEYGETVTEETTAFIYGHYGEITAFPAIDTSVLGTFAYTIATSLAGTVKITVAIADTQYPIISGEDYFELDEGNEFSYADLNITAEDPVDGLLEVNFSGNADTSVPGEYIVIASAQDQHGNSSEKEITVYVRETTTGVYHDTVEPTYIDNVLIVNKTYGLPSTFNPGLRTETTEAFALMKAAAAQDGINLWIVSGYRSYQYQVSLYQRYVKQHGQKEADTFSARPGYSEHQTGYVVDVNSTKDSFANTKEAAWLAEHAHLYGFIIRYPKGKEAITGYQYEPWHLRYLGVSLATVLYEQQLTMEEYFGISSVYAD